MQGDNYLISSDFFGTVRDTLQSEYHCPIIVTPSWLLEVQRLLEHHVEKQEEKIEVQYFHIGNGTLCGVPNELMCEFALNASSILNNNLSTI